MYVLCTLCVHIFFCKFTHDSNLNASARRNNNSLPHEVYNIHSAVAHLLKRGERLFHVVVLFLWLHLCLKLVIQTHTFNEYINQMHDSRVSWPNVIDVFCNSHTTSPLQPSFSFHLALLSCQKLFEKLGKPDFEIAKQHEHMMKSVR